MNVLVVTPTYNERENLPTLVRMIMALDGYRVMVVDDQSPDGTGDTADELARQYPGRVEVVHRTGRRGFSRSYIEGFTRAVSEGWAELVCQMDADLSHDPEFLPTLVAAADEADVVVGSRYLHGISVVNWPLRRLMLSTFANAYVRTITRLRVRDCTSGFRCWRRATLQAVLQRPIRSEGYAFQVETLYEADRLGFRNTEVPIVFVERERGRSKMSSGVVLEAATMPWRLVGRRMRYGRRPHSRP